MEVLYFLKERTAFIRWYYDALTAPLIEDQRKIEAGEEPYEPPYFDPDTDDSSEPPFMEEWTRDRTAIALVGAACVSMLSESLKVYFAFWEKELGYDFGKPLRAEFKKGFVNGYRVGFGHILQTDWSDCPADFGVLEQIALARNSSQHAGRIESMSPSHDPKTREKYTSPLFVSEREAGVLSAEDAEEMLWFNPQLIVSPDTLSEAIRQVELLGEWMEERLFALKYGP